MAYSLSFSDEDELAIESQEFWKQFPALQQQLDYSQDQLAHPPQPSSEANLPRTIADAMTSKEAIVITETKKPFRIVHVNDPWVELCGYSCQEAEGETLGSLLKGPETDNLATTLLISHLLAGQEAGAVLTNYAKDGRRFRNRLRVGAMHEDGTNPTHFVGLLQEIQDGL